MKTEKIFEIYNYKISLIDRLYLFFHKDYYDRYFYLYSRIKTYYDKLYYKYHFIKPSGFSSYVISKVKNILSFYDYQGGRY